MIEKNKSGCPKKYEGDKTKELKNMRQMIYYRKTNGIIEKDEYMIYTLEYKILMYENKLKKLKAKLEEIKNE
jgi:2C-methyl-D-erythritol 2,4-cyclodiphosphate synthase